MNSASRSFLAHPTNDLHRVLHTSLGLYGHCWNNALLKVVILACKHCKQGSADWKMHKLERPESIFSWVFYFLSNYYFRIGSNKMNTFLEIRMVAGAFLSGLLSLTAQRQIPAYEQTGTSELEQEKHFYVTNLLIPSNVEIILVYTKNKMTKSKCWFYSIKF